MGRQASVQNKENVAPDQGSRPKKISKKRKVSPVLEMTPASISSKKMRKEGRPCVPPLTLLTLPYDVKEQLLTYLDIKSMEALAKTCSHFDLMINGRYLTSLNLPLVLNEPFMTEVKETELIEKKPLLKLEFRKPSSSQNYQTEGLHPIFTFDKNNNNLPKYVMESQLRLLSMKKLREVNLLPEEVPNLPLWSGVNYSAMRYWETSCQLDVVILRHLSSVGGLRNISRLDLLLVSSDMAQLLWQDVMPAMQSLSQLNITVVERNAG